jgi:AcrR family transcriptional regulator
VKEVVNISRIHNEKRRKSKLGKILDSARLVFCRKGFLAVTMQDIIDECGISRGGMYFYFSSVDEIFLEVMKQRNKTLPDNRPFDEVIADFFSRQKKRLLNFENSLFRAYCEYIFSKPKAAVEAFRDSQFGHLRKTVLAILMLGVSQGVIRNENLLRLADHIIVVIDGLSVLALAAALTEEMADQQIAILEEMVENIKDGAEKCKVVSVKRKVLL